MSETNDREHAADSPDDTSGEESGANRQFVLGGIIVAVTLAIVAWLAYGVVQRSSTTARAAQLIPGGASGASLTTPNRPGKGASTSSTGKAASTSTTSGVGTHHGSIPATTTQATFANGAHSGISAREFALLWPAYSQAWLAECRSIWSHSSNGKLYDPEDVGSYYTVDECTRTLDTLFLTADITTVAKAKAAGASDDGQLHLAAHVVGRALLGRPRDRPGGELLDGQLEHLQVQRHVVRDGQREQQAVEAVEEPAVTRQECAEVLDAEVALQHRFAQVAHERGDAEQQAGGGEHEHLVASPRCEVRQHRIATSSDAITPASVPSTVLPGDVFGVIGVLPRRLPAK